MEDPQQLLSEQIVAAAVNPDHKVAGYTRKLEGSRVALHQFSKSVIAARKMVLDDDFVRTAVETSVVEPALLFKLTKYTRAPFDSTWIEWDEPVRVKHLNDSGMKAHVPLDVPDRVGFLIERCTKSVSASRYFCTPVCMVDGKLQVSPLRFFYDTEVPVAHDLLLSYMRKDLHDRDAIVNALSRDAEKNLFREAGMIAHRGFYGLGVQYCKMHETQTNELSALGNRFAYSFSDEFRWAMGDGYWSRLSDEHKLLYVQNTMMAITGDFRWLITLLGMMNTVEVSIQQDHHASRGSFQSWGRKIGYHAHNRVSLKLPAARVIAAMQKQTGHGGMPRRRHEVRGSWCHSRKIGDNHCQHDYVMLDDDHYECAHCGRKRWWRAEHLRGDAGLGFVDKEYVIETNPEFRPTEADVERVLRHQ